MVACFVMVGGVVVLGQAAAKSGTQSETKLPEAQRADLQRADVAFRAGYAAMQAGKLEEARGQFATAVKLAPKLPEARMALAAILLQLGRPEDAIPELEKALALKPGEPATEENLAMAYEGSAQALAAKGKLPEAEARMRKAILTEKLTETQAGPGVHPDPIEAKPDAALQAQFQDELGSVLAQEKRWDEAESSFREALTLLPAGSKELTALGPHLHLGIVLLEKKQLDAALVEFKAAAEIAPENALAQFQLGRGLAAAGNDEAAVEHFEAALKVNPTLPEGALELAMARQRLGQQAESIPLFEQAVAAEPNNAEALTNLGLALTETGKAAQGVPYLQRALAEAPKDPVAHEDLGVAELQQAHFDEAIAEFEKAEGLDAANPQLHYDLGLAYKFKDRMGDAERELKRAAELDPTLPDPPHTLGILYMQMGRLAEAATELRRALTLKPADGDGWAILGSVLKQEGKRDEAEAALRKAVELLPDQPGPHITLAGVLAEDGKKDEAAAERKIAAGLSRTVVNHQRAMLSTNAGNQALARGEISEAVGRYQEAIAADPGYAEAHLQLAVAFERQGRRAEAAAERAKVGQK
jgi:Flp pilus assembly protein TadD